MPKVEVQHPDKQVSTGAYSAGLLVDGWLYVSGQGPLDLTTGEIILGTIEEQTALTLEHIRKILAQANCTPDDVVKCTVHLLDINDFDRFNNAYAKFFSNNPKPARTTVQSVLWGNIKVEIDCVAKVPILKK